MMNNKDNNSNINIELKNNNADNSISASTALSDEQRVKVMSPSMLVFKRFIRNRLAVVGFIILAAMFLVSFIGPFFSPYSEAQLFSKDEDIVKDYAEFAVSSDWRFTTAEGVELSSTATTRSILKMNQILALPEGEEPTEDMLRYEAGDAEYYLNMRGEYFFELLAPLSVANIVYISSPSIEYVDEAYNNEAFEAALLEAFATARASEDRTATFMYGEGDAAEEFTVSFTSGRAAQTNWSVTRYQVACIATRLVFHAASEDTVELADSYDFRAACLAAYYEELDTFTVDGVNYTAEISSESANGIEIIELNVQQGGTDCVRMANYSINPKIGGFLDFEFKDALIATLLSGETEFVLRREVQLETSPVETPTPEGEPTTAPEGEGGDIPIPDAGGDEPVIEAETVVTDIEYTIDRRDLVWTVMAEMPARLIDSYSAPAAEHLLGTDSYGMDVATRLMYGGRVSLMVGFIVVFLELFIGVILGGLAGYFSGWVDVIIMRLIELFNCIPFYPMLMIIGSLLDAANVSPEGRIYWLMVVLGLLYWPGIARIVRGQILTLREQDFMVATEASGIPVNRRIFRHLLPNVIPLLIVQATMGLGGIIITEATLSFLGLGVKYPLASWGAIINQASSQHVMTNYWWVWLPAGMLILLTVLGFNFVGDGLRDAFDPKMKR